MPITIWPSMILRTAFVLFTLGSTSGLVPEAVVIIGVFALVVVVNSDEKGNVDMEDLKAKADKHKDHLAALMVR